ncbi:protein GlmU [Desulfococcaceae bacterium HSG9]|nr:protein GlmU [Desulfococcaceae bacterium HSG9]
MIEQLIEKGVKIPNPDSVEIKADVNIDRISGNGTVIHAGCKIFGDSTFIGDNAHLGYEAPVTVDNCQIGPHVQLKGGFFQKAVFLEKANMGSGAHVREGTILEEQANAAHTVGLKHTILLPFVTLGSLINFCDCLMAGGTSRKNHSEVGSSYIHFNYTPNQDKATPSLIGDVPRGVMLQQKPIFLGGQGGLVGPCRLTYGTIIAAGAIHSKDQLKPNRLLLGRATKGGEMPFVKGLYRGLKRTVKNNLIYIANLMALRQWCLHVRSQFIGERFPDALFNGVLNNLDLAIDERAGRFRHFSQKMRKSAEIYQGIVQKNQSALLLNQKDELYSRRNELEQCLYSLKTYEGNQEAKDNFLEIIARKIKNNGNNYIMAIQGLDFGEAETGSGWMQGIADYMVEQCLNIIPSLK